MVAQNIYVCTHKDGSYGVYRDIPGTVSREGTSFSAGIPVSKGVQQFLESFQIAADSDIHFVYKNEWQPNASSYGPVLPPLKDEEVAKIKAKYPEGTALRLVLPMLDPFPIPVGEEGFVQFCDDAGQIHMKWNNGRTLPLNPQVDVFEVI